MEGVAYPSFHGPIYSIFLSWVMRLFGFKLFVFKFTSYLFTLGAVALFYYTFRNRIPSTLLVLTMLLVAVNSELLFFASHTYTEAMFLFMQAALFYLVIRYYLNIEDHYRLIVKHWWVVLLVGLLLFTMTLTRNIGIVIIGVVLFYLVTEKKFYLAGYTLLSFMVFRIPFNIYKSIRWNVKGEDISTQLELLLLKNYYNPGMGKEDLAGMIKRYWDNSEIYLSRLLMTGTGLKNPMNTETSTLVTVVIYALFALALYFAFIRKDRIMRLIGYYLGIVLFVTFVILQQHWGQMRLIIVYIPLIYLFLPWGLLELFRKPKLKWLQTVVILLLTVMFFKQLGVTISRAKANNEVLMQNLRGNRYYGYTPDWINFLRMSEWAAENVPEGSKIASRKASMSFIYGDGRSFYPIYRMPTYTADSVIANLSSESGNYVIINEQELRSANMPVQLEYGMKREVQAFISAWDTLYSVYRFSDQTGSLYTNVLNDYNLEFETNLDYLSDKIRTSEKPGVGVVPDSLVNRLLKANVDYIIRASLRMNPNQKTDRVITTIHRYMYYIEQKYFGIFSQVSRIGGENEEPAYLFKINWERYGLDEKRAVDQD
jgi:hypothetical protein